MILEKIKELVEMPKAVGLLLGALTLNQVSVQGWTGEQKSPPVLNEAITDLISVTSSSLRLPLISLLET